MAILRDKQTCLRRDFGGGLYALLHRSSQSLASPLMRGATYANVGFRKLRRFLSHAHAQERSSCFTIGV